MTVSSSKMRREIAEIPEALERLLSNGAATISRAASEIRDMNPSFLISVARGSSDHAATYLKYASEILLGLPMASVGPSVKSIYGVNVASKNALCLSVSQSGQSPDIVRMTDALVSGGAYGVAITNDPDSPLAMTASSALPIHAGPELSVAATKTFVTSLVAGLWLLAELKQDQSILNAIYALPEHTRLAGECDWSDAAQCLTGESLFTLGRGPSWAISNEAALKIKETCQIHAESYSSAEVLHGPVSIVDQGFPIICFSAADAAEDSVTSVADTLAEKGAKVFVTSNRAARATPLPHMRTGHWITDPIPTIVSFYSMVEMVAVQRGIDPDSPRHLKKVTETV